MFFYNTFISERIKGDKYDEEIYFKINKVRGKTEKENFDAKKTEDGSGDARPSHFFDYSKPEQSGAGTKRYGDSFEHFYGKLRRSAKPKFLAG